MEAISSTRWAMASWTRSAAARGRRKWPPSLRGVLDVSEGGPTASASNRLTDAQAAARYASCPRPWQAPGVLEASLANPDDLGTFDLNWAESQTLAVGAPRRRPTRLLCWGRRSARPGPRLVARAASYLQSAASQVVSAKAAFDYAVGAASRRR